MKKYRPSMYLHPGASLSAEEIKAISEWAADEQARVSELTDRGQKNN
jgi:hypothetical protein